MVFDGRDECFTSLAEILLCRTATKKSINFSVIESPDSGETIAKFAIGVAGGLQFRKQH